MSVACPSCGTSIDADFGVVTCGNCRSVFSVDIDGNVIAASGDMPDSQALLDEMQNAKAKDENQEHLYSAERVIEQLPDFSTANHADLNGNLGGQEFAQADEKFEEAISLEATAEPLTDGQVHDQTNDQTPRDNSTNAAFGNQIENQDFSSRDHKSSDPTSVSSAQEDSISSAEPAQGFSEIPGEMSSENLTLLEEVQGIAGAETQDLGPLSYDLRIEGLLRQEKLDQFKQLTKEPQFGINFSEKLREIQAGVLELKALNPAQAAILQKALHGSGLKLFWRQNALHVDSDISTLEQ